MLNFHIKKEPLSRLLEASLSTRNRNMPYDLVHRIARRQERSRVVAWARTNGGWHYFFMCVLLANAKGKHAHHISWSCLWGVRNRGGEGHNPYGGSDRWIKELGGRSQIEVKLYAIILPKSARCNCTSHVEHEYVRVCSRLTVV